MKDANKDLLKEAIADAKAVRATALQNAKLALEEAFRPQLQSMLSAKLSEELEDEDEVEDTEDTREADDMGGEEEEEDYSDESDESDESEESEESDEDETVEENESWDEDGEEELDLESVIRELEGDEELEDEDMTEGHDSEDDDEELDITEVIRALSEEDSMENEMEDDEMEEGMEADDMDDDENVDISEVIRSLREEDEMEDEDDSSSEEELEEAYNVIRFLKNKINEVNLLNAKLLYSNKLFRSFALNESQKMKVIENFDRAHNLREIKLVYTTLCEGFKTPAKLVKESFASKPVASTRPAKSTIITESDQLAARFKKLAGLKK